MHKLFADWYRQVDLNISADVMQVRWGCVEAAVKKLDVDAVLQLTRVSFGLPKPDGQGGADGAAVVLAFKEADVSFPMKGNEQLLRVLFGVTLAQAMEERHALATVAALAVASAHCAGLVALPPVEELPGIAETYLGTEANARRSRALEDPLVAPKFGKLELVQPGAVDLQETPNQNHWPQVHQNFQNLKAWVSQVNTAIEVLNTASSKTRAEISTAFKANAERTTLENRISVLKEECNVLWWLFGEYSESAKKSWVDGAAAELCIALGWELADLMRYYEPTSNAQSFLSKALSRTRGGDSSIPARELLEATSTKWRSHVVEEVRDLLRRTGGVTPLHAGLVARVDASSRWVERLAEVTGLKPEQQLTAVQWAMQACRERLLLTWLETERGR